MKKFKILAILWVVLVAGTLAGCQKNNNNWDIIIEDITTNDAVINYNDNLVDLASQCIVSEDAVWTAYNDESASADDIQNAITNTLNECNSAIDSIQNLWWREWDTSLQEWVLVILRKDLEYYAKLSELVPYLWTEDQLTEEQAAAYDTIVDEIERIDSELNEANNNLISIQEQFAINHGYELEEQADV